MSKHKKEVNNKFVVSKVPTGGETAHPYHKYGTENN